MGTPINRRPKGAARLTAEALEDRLLLTRTIRGVDPQGDHWVLKLIGPGDFRVTQQNDVKLGQPGQIKDITIVGGETLHTRLEGKVRKGPNGDGKVFFQNLVSLNNPPVPDVNGLVRTNLNGRGLAAVDMPGFFLADTSNGTFTPATGQPTGMINIPDGTTSLRFGGVDTTAFTQPSGTAVTFDINLGLPQYLGTSIVTDTITSDNRPAATPGGTPILDTVTFNVQGRLNLFQANTINGESTPPTSRYQGNNTGGTTLIVGPDVNGTTGQIGYLLVNGNATNFSAQVSIVGPTGASITNEFAFISNTYFGGETNKVEIVSPGGMKNIAFGKGMDAVAIRAGSIQHLVANRGAVNSTVVSNGPIVLADFGGDVINSRVLSGYFVSGTADSPTFNVGAGGRMTVTIAGDIINSIFASSAVPLTPQGTIAVENANSILYENGHLNAKYEGKIDNAAEIPIAPNKAFFANHLSVAHGPVIPPNVNEPPLAPAPQHRGQIGLAERGGKYGHYREANLASPVLKPIAVHVRAGQVTPKGPRRKAKG
jgi:hypothetical protein